MVCTGDECEKCGGTFRMAWLMGDPPEPYGVVCDCADPDYDDARDEKRANDRESARVTD